jgi:hypothetical protein
MIEPKIEDFRRLAGTWAIDQNGRRITEVWMPPDGLTMLGMSRTVAEENTVEHEFLVLRQELDGRITYTAKPSGQAETTFTLVKCSATEAVFENLDHDFPQRILYSSDAEDSLFAAIEGPRNGTTRRIEFPYRRVRQ